MRTKILVVSLCVTMSLVGISFAACPSADLSGDCRVDLNDLAIMASQWLDESPAFVTTWDTSLRVGTTVTLALAGEVDATIDWGDGSDPNHVTTPGPHTHDYGVDGTYTVSVTGSVTAYNSYDNGGEVSECEKLISVDNWGRLGFTSMYLAFSSCSNLVSVPATSDGIEDVTNMYGMFVGAHAFNQDISRWDIRNVTSIDGMFQSATSFNQPIGNWNTSNVTAMGQVFYNADAFDRDISGWDTSNVTSMWGMFYHAYAFDRDISGWDTSSVANMDWMFWGASAFNRDLSEWCVTLIPSEPNHFDTDATSWTDPNWRPSWGECPP